jgi:Protein of unknown function (DUF2568)
VIVLPCPGPVDVLTLIGARIAFPVLGLGAPLLVIVVWGAFVAPKAAVSLREPVRFVLGLIILVAAAVAVVAAGESILGLVFGIVLILNAVLVVLWHQ